MCRLAGFGGGSTLDDDAPAKGLRDTVDGSFDLVDGPGRNDLFGVEEGVAVGGLRFGVEDLVRAGWEVGHGVPLAGKNLS